MLRSLVGSEMCIRDRLGTSQELKLMNSRYSRRRDFEHEIFLLKLISKFPCYPSVHTPGSLSFPRIPTLASLAKNIARLLVFGCRIDVTSFALDNYLNTGGEPGKPSSLGNINQY